MAENVAGNRSEPVYTYFNRVKKGYFIQKVLNWGPIAGKYTVKSGVVTDKQIKDMADKKLFIKTAEELADKSQNIAEAIFDKNMAEDCKFSKLLYTSQEIREFLEDQVLEAKDNLGE